MRTLGFVGLGTMGFPLAGHLAAAGLPVSVFNRTGAKAQLWRARFNGAVKPSPAALAAGADTVITCLGGDPDVREIYLGAAGLLAHAQRGTVFVDHTTTSALLARQLADAAAGVGCQFIDAPVSGGEAGAIAGQLSIMAGGDRAAVDAARPVLAHYAKSITYLGVSGNGQLTKMVNQICVAGVLQGLAEAMVFAERAGLDLALVKQAIAAGAAGSWQLDNRWQTMQAREFDFGFALDWMRKDLGFCRQQAQQLELALPCVELVDQRYANLQAQGYNRADTSVLVKQFDSTKAAVGDQES